MSSGTPATRTWLRIILDKAEIALLASGARDPLVLVHLDDPAIEDRLLDLAAAVRAHGGRLEVVLPEFEIRRGHLDAALSHGRAQRARAALARASLSLAMPIDHIVAVAGTPDSKGQVPWAAVKLDVLAQTDAFLASYGLSADRISAPDSLPPFRERSHQSIFPAVLTRGKPLFAGSAAAAVALAIFLGLSNTAEEDRELQTEIRTELHNAVETDMADVPPPDSPPHRMAVPADIFPPRARPERLALVRVEPPLAAPAPVRVAEVAPPIARIIPPAQMSAPTITKAARNFPATLLSMPELNAPSPLALPGTGESKLPDPAIPSEVLAQIVETLPRTAPEVLGTTRLASLRPLHRPTISDAGPVTSPSTPGMSRPLPRPGVSNRSRAAVSAAINDAVASATAEDLGSRSIVDRPRPRNRAPAASAATVFQPQAPSVIRTAPPVVGTAALAAPADAISSSPTLKVQPAVRVATATPPPQTTATRVDEQVGIDPRELSLIGVFGSPQYKRAILRLPNGQMRKVRAGDRIEGNRVIAISEDSVRLTGKGRDQVLRMSE
ncbi:MAG: hypothetical protein KDK03_00860 [Rhodobacteraceae bacterium]|nr:hypothetical protein [Paracoccaceae bacterium]